MVTREVARDILLPRRRVVQQRHRLERAVNLVPYAYLQLVIDRGLAHVHLQL